MKYKKNRAVVLLLKVYRTELDLQIKQNVAGDSNLEAVKAETKTEFEI